MHDRLAHTAEHAFIGSLQRITGQVLRVRKVEHRAGSNTAFIVVPKLELQTVLAAQAEVNRLIEEGRKVTEEIFASLEDARKAFPGMRANAERITGQVRVVQIERHDVAACAMEHAKDLSECDYFLVTRLSKSGSEYEVDFVVGRLAKEKALWLSATLLGVCSELGANINTVQSTARKTRDDGQAFRRKLRAVGARALEDIRPVQTGRFLMLTGIFSDLDDDQLVEFAGKKISEGNVVVLIANRGSDMARIVFAKSDAIGDIDCNALFKDALGSDGRGGGKSNFVTGAVRVDALKRIVDELSKELTKLA